MANYDHRGGRKISGMHDYFFDGYETIEYVDEKGKRRTRLEYHGKVYAFLIEEDMMRRMRIAFPILAVISYVLLVLGMLDMSPLMQTTFAAAFFTLGILPHLYYTFGLVRFEFLKEEFNNRQYHQSFKRMENGAVIKCGIAALSLILAILYMIFKEELVWSLENIRGMLLIVAFGVVSLVEMRIIHRNRCTIIRDKDKVVVGADPSKGEKEAPKKAKTIAEYFEEAEDYDDYDYED